MYVNLSYVLSLYYVQESYLPLIKLINRIRESSAGVFVSNESFIFPSYSFIQTVNMSIKMFLNLFKHSQ